MTPSDPPPVQAPPNCFIVAVTYNRAEYLARLLESIDAMSPRPAGLVVVDNASTDGTAEVIETYERSVPEGFVHVRRFEENVGGSGGFSAGVETALEQGAEWVWTMDDDVEVLPEALLLLGRWTGRFGCLHGRRWDHDGTPFFWQTRMNSWLGIFYPRPGDVFEGRDYFLTNSGTFEGMMIRRDVVEQIGLPDPRFFLTWDDAVYAWLASQITEVAYVNAFVLRRLRPQRSISLGIRHLNDSSDLSRYYVMRNRGYVANYLAAHDRYRPVGFALGTFLTFGKEMLRSVAVEHSVKGIAPILRGYRASRALRRDPSWRPMPPLTEQD
ncbi:MAG TPA: glycosyltransferase [Nocardioidaceae bacterium]